MLYEDNKGFEGFFEDLPVLIVVTIGIGIFLISIIQAYATYLEEIEKEEMRDNCNELCEAMRNYSELTYESTEGLFLGDKIKTLTLEMLKEDFNESALGYQYQISVLDKSDYSGNSEYTRTFRTSEEPSRAPKFTTVSSVLIKVNDEYHAAQLIITIWR